jgi:hypothetical protein
MGQHRATKNVSKNQSSLPIIKTKSLCQISRMPPEGQLDT